MQKEFSGGEWGGYTIFIRQLDVVVTSFNCFGREVVGDFRDGIRRAIWLERIKGCL